MVNILIAIALFVTYRMVIAEKNHAEGNFLDDVLQILDLLLNLAYSSIYLIAITFFSLTLFLNLIDKIRNNVYLSLLTFLGIPLLCVISIVIAVAADGLLELSTVTVFRNLIIFSIIYLFFTTLQFLFFRRRVNKLRSE